MRVGRRALRVALPLYLGLALLAFPGWVSAQGTVKLSREMVETMAKSAVVRLDGLAGAASELHVLTPTKPSNDCEFHFRFMPSDDTWRGDPYPHYVPVSTPASTMRTESTTTTKACSQAGGKTGRTS